MSSSEEDYDYDQYALEVYEQEEEGPSLIRRKSRLIAAVVQNNVDLLRDLLDSPKWYKTKDKSGYNLLQIAILRNNKAVFDYIISLADFPLEFVNKYGETALMISLTRFVSNDIWMSSHFAHELIKKGACVHKLCDDGDTLLHCALRRNFTKVAKLLIEAGIDVNAHNNDGEVPLDLAQMTDDDDVTEAVTALLTNGADPMITNDEYSNFEWAIYLGLPTHVKEVLFLYTFDDHSDLKTHLESLLKLAETESALFYNLIDYPLENCMYEEEIYNYLFSINYEYLNVIVEKIGNFIISSFTQSDVSPEGLRLCKRVRIENCNFLLENRNWTSLVTNFISKLNSNFLLKNMIKLKENENEITELFCFLLSHGLNINEMDLQLVYKTFGYSELFKILLHMDVEMVTGKNNKKDIVPIFIYDVTVNLQRYCRKPFQYSVNNVSELLNYYAHPKAKELCEKTVGEVVMRRKNLPDVPLLRELSRDVFRKFFVEKFQIKTTKQFYSLLRCLQINSVYKRIISFETKLYV